MALSEHEQRVLREMERALYSEDPRFATNIRNAGSLRNPRTGLFALLTAFGIAGIIAGVALPMTVLGIAGFVGVLAGLYGILMAARSGGARTPKVGSKSRKSQKTSFIERAEERFRQRRDGDQ